MAIMQKVNRQITVKDDEEKTLLLADGWNEVDKKGKVISKGKNDKKDAALEKALADLEAENVALKAEIEKLAQENAVLKDGQNVQGN